MPLPLASFEGEADAKRRDEVNGAATAVPNAEVTANPRPPFPGTAQDHHAAALKYFLAAGLPADQIGPIRVITEMRGGHGVMDPRPADKFLGYSSIITRQIGGVPVAESFAMVSFDVDGNVVNEGVFWPDLPASVTQDINAITSMRASATQLAAFKQSVEAAAPGYSSDEGVVVVHHQMWTERGAQYGTVTYDVRAQGQKHSPTRHFDLNGSEVTFKRQFPIVPASPRPNP